MNDLLVITLAKANEESTRVQLLWSELDLWNSWGKPLIPFTLNIYTFTFTLVFSPFPHPLPLTRIQKHCAMHCQRRSRRKVEVRLTRVMVILTILLSGALQEMALGDVVLHDVAFLEVETAEVEATVVEAAEVEAAEVEAAEVEVNSPIKLLVFHTFGTLLLIDNHLAF